MCRSRRGRMCKNRRGHIALRASGRWVANSMGQVHVLLSSRRNGGLGDLTLPRLRTSRDGRAALLGWGRA